MTPPPTEPPEKRQQQYQVNTFPLMDEYEENKSKDEFDRHKQSLHYLEEDDETIEALIRSFSPPKDHNFEDEIQLTTLNKGKSPRRFQHNKCNLKVKT